MNVPEVDAARAIDRVAGRVAPARFAPDDALLFAAVGVLAGRGPGPARWSGPGAPTDPATALVLAAGAARVRGVPLADHPESRRELVELAGRVPAGRRAQALAAVESVLAPVDPDGAWALICRVLGPRAAVEAALGLDVAAHLDLDRGADWSPSVPLPAAFADQLVADRVARGTIAGRSGSGRSAPADPLDPGAPAASPARAQVLLVAVAATQPERALAVAATTLGRHSPRELGDALRLTALLLVRAGLREPVAAMAHHESYVAEQCSWTAAAAWAGALPPGEVAALADELAGRVADELDPGREPVAGLPLVEALLSSGELEAALVLAARWQLPASTVVRRCLQLHLTTTAAALADEAALDVLLAEHDAPLWWAIPGASRGERSSALRDVLVVVGSAPWSSVPGSLADVLGVALPVAPPLAAPAAR